MKTSVCIIGSGVAAGVTATELMDRGMRDIVMIECGERVKMRDYRTWMDMATRSPSAAEMDSPFAALTLPNHIDVPAYARGRYTADEIENVGPQDFNLPGATLRIRGGTTVHFEGWSYRLKPEDFELQTRTGKGSDWPISYEDLEPYYNLAEETMQVAGDATDKDHPPRNKPLPLPAFPFQRSDQTFLKAMADNGWTTSHTVICRNTESIKGQAQCQTIGTCRYCLLGARFSGDQVLDRLESRSGFKLLTETTVVKLLPRSRSNVRAIEVLDQKSGKTQEIEADLFIVAAGAAESAKLLLASAGATWPAGPGNESDLVGRCLMNHPLIFGQSQHPVPGHTPSETDFPTAFSRHFDTPEEQATGKFVISNQGMGSNLRWHMLKGKSVDQIKSFLDEGWPLGPIITMGEQFPDPANRITLAGGVGPMGLPRTRIYYSFDDNVRAMGRRQTQVQQELFASMGVKEPLLSGISIAAHPMGTCKMATQAKEGVVDADLKVHGVDNLYMCGAGAFPSGGAGNPTLTIVALAHRLGEHLASGTKSQS